MGDNIFLGAIRKQQRTEGNKKYNYNIINFNDEYFEKFLKLFKYSLTADNNKRDVKNYDEYIINSLDKI